MTDHKPHLEGHGEGRTVPAQRPRGVVMFGRATSQPRAAQARREQPQVGTVARNPVERPRVGGEAGKREDGPARTEHQADGLPAGHPSLESLAGVRLGDAASWRTAIIAVRGQTEV